MRRTTIVFGPPGTGKTTYLLDRVEEALAAGTPPDRIGFFAFTRKAAHEAMYRAIERFGLDEEDFPWFRTLHSTAYHMLGLSKSDVMQPYHYRQLGEALGSFTFEGAYDESIERVPLYGGLGDRALSLYAMSRATVTGLEDVWRNAHDPKISLHNTARFTRALQDFKRSEMLLDFSDFLDQVYSSLDLDLAIFDEAQDLTRQQWDFARRIAATAGKVYIAGDDDQAIFQWAGSDLKSFLGMNGELVVLPYSHRLPSRVFNVCDSVISRVRYRKPKDWQPRPEPGRVDHVEHPEQINLKGEASWMLLARNKYQLAELEQICRGQGVVYQHKGEWSNATKAVRAVLQYESIRNGQSLSPSQIKNVARYIPGMDAPEADLEQYSWQDVAWPFQDRPTWMEALTGLGGDEREYIRRLKREGESLTRPGRVTLSTIHGVKGGEADYVMFGTDISKRVFDGLMADPEQEARVWYVAASRAKQGLTMVMPRSQRFFAI